MGQRSDTRARMVEAARELIRERGMEATGFTQVLEASGAARGAIYHHFPAGKEELAIAVVEVDADAVVAGLERAANGRTMAEGMERFVRWYADRMVETSFRFGCPVANTAVEIATRSEPIRQATATAFGRWVETLARLLVRDGMTAELAHERAVLTIASFEGALIISRAAHDTAPLLAVGNQLRTLLVPPTDGGA